MQKNIRPDSFSGLIFGLEGLKNGAVLLNGPTGCKFYHSAVVDGALLRSLSFDPLKYPEKFYFGQGRVPCTYLDENDYVYGAKDKLISLLEEVKTRNHDFVALVNSPGASLIGDDLQGILDQNPPAPVYFPIDIPPLSLPYGQGLQEGLMALLDNLNLEKKPVERGRVNLLGLHLYQKYALSNVKEITRLLELAGLTVGVSFLDQDIETIGEIGRAELNIVLSPENGASIAKYLEDRLGMKTFTPSSGFPIGFDGTESFFRELAQVVALDLEPVIGSIQKARGRAYIYLSRFASLLGGPKGATYGISAETSLALPLVDFLTDYLGLIPLYVHNYGAADKNQEILLKEKLRPFCQLNEEPTSQAQIILGDGNDVASQVDREGYLFGIEIAEPSMGYLDVVEKTLVGPKGALHLLEQILNGLKFS